MQRVGVMGQTFNIVIRVGPGVLRPTGVMQMCICRVPETDMNHHFGLEVKWLPPGGTSNVYFLPHRQYQLMVYVRIHTHKNFSICNRVVLAEAKYEQAHSNFQCTNNPCLFSLFFAANQRTNSLDCLDRVIPMSRAACVVL